MGGGRSSEIVCGDTMSQLANKVAVPGVDFGMVCGSIPSNVPSTHFAQGANLQWQK